MAYNQFISLLAQSSMLDASFSILLPQIYLIQPQFYTFDSASSITSKKIRIFDSKSPQKKAWFPTKCPQAPLAPFAAFFRSAYTLSKENAGKQRSSEDNSASQTTLLKSCLMWSFLCFLILVLKFLMTSTYHLFEASISGLQEAFILHLRDAKCATYSDNQGQ